MHNYKISAAIAYRVQDHAKGLLTIFGILVAVGILLLVMITPSAEGEITFSFSEMSFFIYALVMGIMLIRADLRFFVQNGMNRRQTFFVEQITGVVLCLVIGLVGLLINWLCLIGAQAAAPTATVTMTTFAYMLYGTDLSTFGSAVSTALLFSLFAFVAYEMGLFISAFYYRVSRFLKVVLSIAIPALFVFVLPYAATLPAIAVVLGKIGTFLLTILESPFFFSLTLILLSLAFAGGGWLFLRKAAVK